MQRLKTKLHSHILDLIDARIKDLEEAIHSAKESRDSDTKSSAGDKHETSRAMLQEELDKQEFQLKGHLKLQSDMKRIRIERVDEHIGFGSFVKTDQGIFYISVGLGQIEMEGKVYFVISSGSPIGTLLIDKKVGEKVVFQKKEFFIEGVF